MRIGELARRTGIEAGTLRAWERRFGLLQPTRSKGGQRQYSESDVTRVMTVRRLIDDGLTVAAAAERVVRAGDGATASESENQLLEQILQSLDEGILVGKDARPRYANRRAAQMLGCSVEELLSRSMLDFIPVEETRKARGKMTELRQGVVPKPFDQRIRRPDGTTIVVDSHVRPMFDRAGRYEGSVAIMRDVTDQRTTEAQDRFRAALLDAVGEALMAATTDGTIAYMNEAAEVLWGWKAEEVIGRPTTDFPVAEGTLELRQEMWAHAAANKPFSCDLPTVRRDGSQIMCHFTMTPVRSAEGEFVGRIVVFRDLTEEREREQQIHIRDLRASAVAVFGARAVAKVSDDDALIYEIIEATRRLVSADRTQVAEMGDGGKLSVRASVPEGEPVTLPAGGGSLAGYTMLAGIARIRDTLNDRGPRVRSRGCARRTHRRVRDGERVRQVSRRLHAVHRQRGRGCHQIAAMRSGVSSSRPVMTTSAVASTSGSGGKSRLGTAMIRMPAAPSARSPFVESSTPAQRSGVTPSRRAASR
jgi:PAS domain S-box-containing protein